MLWRNTQEITQIQELNSQLQADLERRQMAETRQLHKNLKSETRTRTMQFKKSQRISSMPFTAEQELERIKEVAAATGRSSRAEWKETAVRSIDICRR